jgi:cyclophilin family peptidyl-prolyl cis-trans isomerase
MRGKKFTGVVIGFLLLAAGAYVAWSQDKTKGAKTKSAAPATGSKEDFTKLHADWVKIVVELREIQKQYRLAKIEEQEGLTTKFNEKLEQARAMLTQLAAAGEAAFKADPKDTELQLFLAELAMTCQNFNDDHDLSLRLFQALIEGGSLPAADQAGLYTHAAHAAMEQIPPRFDLAEKYLASAAEAAKTSSKEPPLAKALRDKLPKEKEYWAAEAAVREAEAKAASDPAKALPRVSLMTNEGEIVLELFENEAPNTVANFISLIEKKDASGKNGFYDGLTFHRVVPQFVIQGGCPKGDGTGGPGYHIPCECYEKNARRHFRGSLSMAHAGRDTGGSQFFICLSTGDNVRNLDAKFTADNKPNGGHTVFGRVVSGWDVMTKIQRRNPQQATRADWIEKATVVRKRTHPYVPKKVGDKEAAKDKETKKDEKAKDEKAKDDKSKDDKAKKEAEVKKDVEVKKGATAPAKTDAKAKPSAKGKP